MKECTLLKLCCDKALACLNWRATLDFDTTMRFTAKWYEVFYKGQGADIYAFTQSQIQDYCRKAPRWGCRGVPMESVIKDVELQDLAVIPTNGGPVMHMMRPASPLFGEIGEVYFSEVEPGCVKAWKCHTRQTQRFAVPVGRLKIVLYDGRPESPTYGRIMEVLLGRPDNYALLQSRRVSGTALRRRGAFLRLSATARTSRTIRRKGSARTSIRRISLIIGNTSGQGFPCPFFWRPPCGATYAPAARRGRGGNPRRLT